MRPQRRSFAAAALAVAAVFVATVCVPGSAQAGAGSSDDHVRHVVVVSVDGLNPNALSKLGPGRAPVMHRMIREGAFTLNARTVFESTQTLPNHTSMFTGRRVNPRRGGHGIAVNRDRGTTVHAAAGEYTASVFDVVHDHGMDTALYAGKGKFALFDRSWGPRFGAPDTTGHDHGRDKIDTFVYSEQDHWLVERAAADIADGPAAFTFLHLAEPDRVGHEYRYMGWRYLRAVRRADLRIGSVIAALESRPGLAEKTVVVVTSDHGGYGYRHNDPTRRVNYRVPFMVLGPGVAAGMNLYQLSSAYRSPGKRRPAYRALRQPVRNASVANLVTDLLDLPAVPGSTIGSRQDLNVFPR